jgi:uncharacterized protein YrrD
LGDTGTLRSLRSLRVWILYNKLSIVKGIFASYTLGMEKLYSNIVGTPIKLHGETKPVATVRDIILDPETGKIVALVVNKRTNKIIVPHDVVEWGDILQVHNHDAIIEADEVLRVGEILKRNAHHIFQNKVVSVDGENLGIVTDYAIDARALKLTKLFVAKVFLGLIRYGSRIINEKNIIEILPDRIVVKNLQEVKEEKGVKAEDLAVG